jgi:hypothetical protein
MGWDRTAAAAGFWETTPQGTAGVIRSKHGNMCVVSHPFFYFYDVTFPTPHTQAYTFDPVENLSTAQAKLVLGGQHLLWTEQSGPENLDPIVWPRAAASAEVFWTGPVGNGNGSDDRDVRTALPRLHELAYRFRRRGVRAISLQPEWCALRPFECDLTA